MSRIGATTGLANLNCSRMERKAEQVYVNLIEDLSHPVEIDAWVGYDKLGSIRLTRGQAIDLIALLAKAMGS